MSLAVWSVVKSISSKFIWPFTLKPSINMAPVMQFGWLWFLQNMIIGLLIISSGTRVRCHSGRMALKYSSRCRSFMFFLVLFTFPLHGTFDHSAFHSHH